MNRLHGIIFAYEQRPELRELTERRTAASIPFGGRYRAVDFTLSNLLNAGVTDVGLVLHGRYQSMLDHVGSGKVWDMSRKRGGLHLLPPFNYLHDWGVTPFPFPLWLTFLLVFKQVLTKSILSTLIVKTIILKIKLNSM